MGVIGTAVTVLGGLFAFAVGLWALKPDPPEQRVAGVTNVTLDANVQVADSLGRLQRDPRVTPDLLAAVKTTAAQAASPRDAERALLHVRGLMLYIGIRSQGLDITIKRPDTFFLDPAGRRLTDAASVYLPPELAAYGLFPGGDLKTAISPGLQGLLRPEPSNFSPIAKNDQAVAVIYKVCPPRDGPVRVRIELRDTTDRLIAVSTTRPVRCDGRRSALAVGHAGIRGFISCRTPDGIDHYATVFGTPDDDVLHGTEGDDVIVGLGGNDKVDAKGGNDIVCLGSGDDSADGGPGNDQIYGESGADSVTGAQGIDLVDGGDGNDQIDGGAGGDVAGGGDGNDQIDGGAGGDVADGGDGNDRILGGLDDDTRLKGGPGLDTISGGAGRDTILGGPDRDILDGGVGIDTIDGQVGADAIRGGAGGDKINGGPGADTINGEPGGDRLRGGGGADKILGDAGNDFIFGEEGADASDGGLGVDLVNGGSGRDSCVAAEVRRSC